MIPTLNLRKALIKKFVYVPLWLLVLSSALAQTEGIIVTGTGTVYGEPDSAVLELGVNLSGEDVGALSDEAAALVTRLKEALAGAGVAADDIRSSHFNVWREDRFDPENQGLPPLYRVTHAFSVRVREVGRAGDLLGVGLEAGANMVNGVHYALETPGELARQARELAVQDAQAKAEHLAALTGSELGELVMVSDGQPLPGPAMALEGGSVPVSGGQLAVSATVQLRFALK